MAPVANRPVMTFPDLVPTEKAFQTNVALFFVRSHNYRQTRLLMLLAFVCLCFGRDAGVEVGSDFGVLTSNGQIVLPSLVIAVFRIGGSAATAKESHSKVKCGVHSARRRIS